MTHERDNQWKPWQTGRVLLRLAALFLASGATVLVLERIQEGAWSMDEATGLLVGGLAGIGLLSLWGAVRQRE